MKESELRIGLLISGSGTTAEAVIKACQQERLPKIKPVVVISSRPDTTGVQKAQRLGIKTLIVQPGDFPTSEAFGERLLTILKTLGVDFVSQNGWLVKTPSNVIEEYERQIINQHPGPLDPGRVGFGGKGMYGTRVSCARLAYEWAVGESNPWTESTTHYVNEEYDQGKLIRVVQMQIPSLPYPVTVAELEKENQYLRQTSKDIQAQLLPLEHKNVIATLQSFANGGTLTFERPQALIPKNTEHIVDKVKQLAIQLFPKG